MKTRLSTAFLLLLSATVHGDDLQPLVPQGKEDFLPEELLEKAPVSKPVAENYSDEVLVESMKGLLLLNHPEAVELNPNIEGVVLKDLELPGDSEVLLGRLYPLIVNQPLTQNLISQIKREITLGYQKNNRPVVAVIVPQQDVTDGVLQVAVVEGKVGDVNYKGGKYFTPERMQSKFTIKSGDTVDTDRLLSDLAWINQNPFRQTNISLTPGTIPGSTDIQIETNDRLPVRMYIGGDNTGNHFTGRNRWYIGFNWGDAFGVDQLLSFQYTTSSDFHKFQSYTGNYSIPLPWHNTLTFFGGYSTVRPKIDKHTTNDGWSGQASARYLISVGKTYGNFVQNVQAGYDFKATNNSLEFNGKVEETKTGFVNQFLASYYAGYTPNHHKINADIDIFFSPGNWYGEENEKAFQKLNPGAKTSYIYTRLALGDEITFSKYKFGLWMLGRAQLSSSNLVPSEQFGLGGYDTIRGYEQRIANYDNAFCFNFELRAPSFSLLRWFGSKYRQDQLILLAFLDYGIGWAHHDESVSKGTHIDPKSQTLFGVGSGLRYRLGPWFYARLDYGWPITDVNDKGYGGVLDFGLLASY